MIMKRIFTLLSAIVLMGTALPLAGQDHHFLYVQSEDGQPFYIKMNEQLFSSTASGYAIISKLERGAYNIIIGFPRDRYPEEEFRIIIEDDNQGLILRNHESQRVLVNLNSQVQLNPLQKTGAAEPPASSAIAPEAHNTDPFSSLLADVIRDSSILRSQKPAVAAKQVQAADVNHKQASVTVEPVTTAPSESSVATATPPAEPRDHHEEVIPDDKRVPVKNPFVRILMVNQESGQEMVYVNTVTNDTVRLFVAASGPAELKEEPQQARIIYQPEEVAEDTFTITPTKILSNDQKAETKENKSAIIIYEPEADSSAKPAEKVTDTEGVQMRVTVSVNPDCKAFATEKDFLRLRKRMAGVSDAYKMIDAARRLFQSKCYTTEQIRNLSYLFADDEGRYQFFDASYPHVSDRNNFAELQAQLHDPYYLNRFKALISK